jgi:hypothetical protein
MRPKKEWLPTNLILLGFILSSCAPESTERLVRGTSTSDNNSTTAICETHSPPPQNTSPESKTHLILAASSWQAFPMIVARGDRLQIISSGEWNGGQGWCGAEGCNGTGPSFSEDSPCYATNDCVAGLKNLLILKIVSDDVRLLSFDDNLQMGENLFKQTRAHTIATDFESGSSLFEVEESGRLYFRNSDSDLGLHDNSGGLFVTVIKR